MDTVFGSFWRKELSRKSEKIVRRWEQQGICAQFHKTEKGRRLPEMKQPGTRQETEQSFILVGL